MKALARRAKEVRAHPTIVEDSADYEPLSNGLAERCAQMMEGVGCDYTQRA